MKVSISYYKNKDNQKPDEYTGDYLQDIFIHILNDLGYKVELINPINKVEIGWGELDIYVDGKKVLKIGQVSDEHTINLFLTPRSNSNICESLLHQEDSNDPCTHELLCIR